MILYRLVRAMTTSYQFFHFSLYCNVRLPVLVALRLARQWKELVRNSYGKDEAARSTTPEQHYYGSVS